MGWFRLFVLVALCLGRSQIALAQAEDPDKAAALAAEVAALELELAENPKDVDLQLKLAFRLSWQNKPKQARTHAEAVLAIASEYWDAHVLLARLDAWTGRYKEAREHLRLVLAADAKNRDALLVKADVELWSKHYDRSEEAVLSLIELEPSADLYYRLAQIALIRMDPVRARGLANRALELDPDHARAKALRSDIQYLKFYATGQTEFYPAIVGEGRQAYSQSFVLSLMPGGSLGVALVYDFHRRFGTDNHRVGARINLRLSDDLILSTFLRGGKVLVLPDWSADIGFVYKLSSDFALGAKYNWDKMHWPGTLHRGTGSVSSQVSKAMLLEAEYFGGVMRHCGISEFVQGVALKSRWKISRLGLGFRYGFGTEVERPPLPAYLQGRLDEDFCLDDLGMEVDGSPLDLAETRAHDLGAEAALQITGSTVLQGGYGIQLRFDNSEVHIFHLSLQQAI